MMVTLSGRLTFSSFEHILNAELPIWMTPSGTTTSLMVGNCSALVKSAVVNAGDVVGNDYMLLVASVIGEHIVFGYEKFRSVHLISPFSRRGVVFILRINRSREMSFYVNYNTLFFTSRGCFILRIDCSREMKMLIIIRCFITPYS